MLGMGSNVAKLSATLTLDSDGFVRGMKDASTKLDAYDAKLKEAGVSSRLAQVASRDYAKQLYDEAKSIDNANSAHGRLYRTMQFGERHWKSLGLGAAGAATGVLALTGNLGSLTGIIGQLGSTAMPILSSALTGLLSPLTSMAAVVVGMISPLTALLTLFGVVGGGAGFGLLTALTSGNKAFNDLQNRVGNMKHMFHDLGNELGQRFLPYINSGVTWIEKFIQYGDKLSHMTLPQIIQSVSTQGMTMLKRLNKGIFEAIGKPLLQIFSGSFGGPGNRISGAFAHMLDVWKPLVGKMWGIFTSWFDKQHFEQTGAEWASAIVNKAVPVIARGLFHALETTFESENLGAKIGTAIAVAFAANLATFGLLGAGVRGGAGVGGSLLKKILLGGAETAGGGAAGAGAAGGAEAAGGSLLGAIGVGALVAAVVPAALLYLSTRSHPSALTKIKTGDTIQSPRNPNSPIYLGAPGLNQYGRDVDVIKKLAAAEAALNQQIDFGGKSAKGWKDAWKSSTKTAGDAQSAIQDLKNKGIISAGDAVKEQKANLQNYINQQDAIAKKAQAASHNTNQFGAAARAQYAHVAALARTSAQLAQAIGSVPSRKYVELVVSVTENLKTEGLNPGNARTKQGLPSAVGGIVAGGVPNTDSVPILAMPGEVVLNKSAVSMLGGPDAANSLNLNGGNILKYAGGGPVGFPNTVLDAPTFSAPKWYHADRYYTKKIHYDQHEINAARKHLNALIKAKAHPKAIAAARRHLAALENKKRDAAAGRAGNQPRLQTWMENQVSSLSTDMDFREQTWDSEYQRTGDTSWFNKEQNQRLQEIKMYERAATFASKYGFGADATAFKQSAVGIYEDYQNAAASNGPSSTASATDIQAFLAAQAGYVSQFGSNIRGYGGPAATKVSGGGTRSTSGGVTVVQHITMTDPDPFHLARRAAFAAQAAF